MVDLERFLPEQSGVVTLANQSLPKKLPRMESGEILGKTQ
jgi:hypothetical protein